LASVAKTDEEVGDRGGVRRRSLPHRRGALGAVGADPQSDQAEVVVEVDTVDHERRQVRARGVLGQ
jgi:hypothetical protein